jgi:hypothetical protein
MLEQLLKLLIDRQGELRLSLAQGTPATWEYYQRLVGRYEGIQEAQTLLEKLLRDADRDE